MICRWCREPVETVESPYAPSGYVVLACKRAACLAARRTEHVQQAYARAGGAHPLARSRPAGPGVACLPGMHEPYGFTPPGMTPVCRHCGAELPQEATP